MLSTYLPNECGARYAFIYLLPKEHSIMSTNGSKVYFLLPFASGATNLFRKHEAKHGTGHSPAVSVRNQRLTQKTCLSERRQQ